MVGYHGNQAKAEAVAGELAGSGHFALPAPMSDSAILERLASTVTERLGRTDILVNAAGMTRPVAHQDLAALTDDLIDEVFKVNWRGPFATVRAFRFARSR